MLGFLVVAAGCGGGDWSPATVDATVDGQPWHASGQGSIVPASDGSTAFTVLAGSRLPGSVLFDASKPILTIVFPRAVPAPGTYTVSDQITLNGTYEPTVDLLYVLAAGSVEIDSVGTTRAQGSFSLQGVMSSPTESTVMLTGTFDVPVTTVR